MVPQLPKWSATTDGLPHVPGKISSVLAASGIPEDKWSLVFPYLIEDAQEARFVSDDIVSKNLAG